MDNPSDIIAKSQMALKCGQVGPNSEWFHRQSVKAERVRNKKGTKKLVNDIVVHYNFRHKADD